MIVRFRGLAQSLTGRASRNSLAKATARFNGIIASAMDAIISVDAGQRVILFNPAAERMFGIAADEALGQHLNRFIPERFRAAHTGHVTRFGETGVSNRHMGALGKIYGLRANGQEFPIEASISQVEVGGEQIFTVILRDITLRERAENAQARLAAIVESSEDAILSTNLDGIVTTWNPAAQRLFGYRAEEIIGQPITIVTPPDRRTEETAILERLRRGEHIQNYETVRVAKDGHSLEVSLTVSTLPDAAGIIVGVSRTIRDIGPRKEIERALVEEEKLLHRQLAELRSIYEGAPAGLAFLDKDLRYVHINQQMADWHGRTVEEHIGRTLREVLPQWADSVEPLYRKVLDTQIPITNIEVSSPTSAEPGVHHSWLVSYFPVKCDLLWGVNTVAIDITERKRTEQALRAAREELARANQDLERRVRQRTAKLRETVAELEAFSYSLSHDMRAPLRAIQSYVELALQQSVEKLDPQAIQFLHNAIAAAQRMDRLILDMLALARLSDQHLQLQPLDPEDLLRRITASRPNLQPPQTEVRIESPLLPVLAQETLLAQCLVNLLDNAAKFVRRGIRPQIRIWTEEVHGPESTVQSPQSRVHSPESTVHSIQYPASGFGSKTMASASNRRRGKRSSAFSNGSTRPRNLKAPASAWPSSGALWRRWAAAPASSLSPATAAASGSNCPSLRHDPRSPSPSSQPDGNHSLRRGR